MVYSRILGIEIKSYVIQGVVLGALGFYMTTQYADPKQYGQPHSNFDTWDLIFPIMIAAYIIYFGMRTEGMRNENAKEKHELGGEMVSSKPAPSFDGITMIQGSASDAKLEPGTTTVLLFWAAWCPRCREALPKLNTLWRRSEDKDVKQRFRLLGLSQDDNSEVQKVLQGISDKNDHCSFPLGVEKGSMTKRFLVEWDVSAVPHCFVINKAGNVTWHGHPHSVEKALKDSFDAEADAEYTMVEKQPVTPREGGKAAKESVPNVAS
jgi:cytochrome c-type biogenesis protein